MAETRNTKLIVSAVDQTQAALSAVGRGLNDLNKHFGGLLGPVTALIGVGGLAGFIQKAVDTGDELNKLAQKTGASVEALSRYQYAAKLANTSNDELRTGLVQLQKNLGEALADPAGRTARTFQALGVSVTDAGGKLRNTDAVLNDLAKRFEAAPDGPAKTAAAMAILGKSGAELIPFLNSLREGTAEAERLGLTVSTGFAQSAERFNDELTRMSTSMQLFLATSEKSAPILDGLTSSLKGVTWFALGIAQGFEEAGKGLGAYAAATVSVAKLEFGQAREILKLLDQDLADIQKRGEAAREALFSDRPITKLSQLKSQAIILPPAAVETKTRLGGISAAEEAFRAEAEVSPGASAAAIEARANLEESTTREAAERLAEVRQEALAREVEQLSQTLLTETDLQNAKYASDLQTLYDMRAAEYLTRAQFNDARELQETQHRARLGDIVAQAELKRRQIEQMSWQQRLTEAEKGFAKLVPLMQSKYRAIFEIGKLAAISSVAVKIPQGAVEAYEAMLPIPIIGPALGIAASMAYVGFSLEQMAEIQGTSFGSAAAGGATPTFDVSPSTGLPLGTPGGNAGAAMPVPQPDDRPLQIVVNLDGQPILETVQRASADGRIVINAHAVR